ncbi:hypothetical protein QZH41_006116 [Actinostola sp. cb2023]|nr:hypothetical protein QZH41_006116 [Actinostola sp. cb2023]
MVDSEHMDECYRKLIKYSENVFQNWSSASWFDGTTVTGQRSATHLPSLLTKVRARRPLTMVVIGGSNSAGGGLDNDGQKYFNLIAESWNKDIYRMTGSTLTVHSMAIGGSGSDFFLMCLQNYLPQQPPDIVLVEEAVNDHGRIYGKAAQPMELLTRRLLLLPSKPLVTYVNFVNPSLRNGTIGNTECTNMENLGFDELAKHYGIPYFSMKDFVCPLTSDGARELTSAQIDMLALDGMHAGWKTHAKIASSIIEYFKNALTEEPGKDNSELDLPSLVKPLFSEPLISDAQLVNAMCWSALTPNWKVPLRQTLDAHVTESRGFRYISPVESLSKLKLPRSMWHTDGHGGWNYQSGTNGIQGKNGTQGTNGTEGTLGIQGANGTQGTQRTLGTLGIQGTQGTNGTQGTQGTLGTLGIQGTNGIQGTQGTLGIQGTNGTQGTLGIQGTNGTQGTLGTNGTQGTELLTIRFTYPSDVTSGNKTPSALRSVVVVVRMRHFATSFRMSLDDDRKSCVDVAHGADKGQWSATRLYPIATEITPGNYTLNIELRVGILRVSGIVIGYRGYHAYEGYKIINETVTNCNGDLAAKH